MDKLERIQYGLQFSPSAVIILAVRGLPKKRKRK